MTREKSAGRYLCTWPGCPERWTQNMGRRLCSEHAVRLASGKPAESGPSLALPTRTVPKMPALGEVVKDAWWNDREDA